MGNTVVQPNTYVGVYKTDEGICLSGLNANEQWTRDCTNGDDLGDGSCKTVDLGNGYEGEVCFRRTIDQQSSNGFVSGFNNGVRTQPNGGFIQQSNNNDIRYDPNNGFVSTNNGSRIVDNTVWEIDDGVNRPVTLSESDVSMLSGGSNGRRSNGGDLRIQPLSNGGISIRFD